MKRIIQKPEAQEICQGEAFPEAGSCPAYLHFLQKKIDYYVLSLLKMSVTIEHMEKFAQKSPLKKLKHQRIRGFFQHTTLE